MKTGTPVFSSFKILNVVFPGHFDLEALFYFFDFLRIFQQIDHTAGQDLGLGDVDLVRIRNPHVGTVDPAGNAIVAILAATLAHF